MATASQTANTIQIKNSSKFTFKKMWNRKDLSDVTLSCAGVDFHMHRFMLAACSPYFRCLFQSKQAPKLHIFVEEVDSGDLKRLLRYMYNGVVAINNDDLQGFCELLEKFKMPMPAEIAISSSESESSNSETDSEGIVAGNYLGEAVFFNININQT